MSRVSKIPPALKHGIYCATAVLPGEDLAAFKKLHRGLIAELAPTGPLEDDIVATLARFVWRKQNLTTIRMAEFARERRSEIWSEIVPSEFPVLSPLSESDPAEREEAIRVADDQARKELGDSYKLVETGEAATFDALRDELDFQERLDGLIYKCLKRLLFLRGLKSMSAASPALPAPAETPRAGKLQLVESDPTAAESRPAAESDGTAE